jgi:anti-sigma regulatory factor (Ser/Thr protein kinase)
MAFPSRRDLLPVVREVATQAALAAGFEEAAAAAVGAAAEAAACNVVEHGYSGAEDGRVELWVDDRGSELRIELRDNGRTMDPRPSPRGRTGRGMRLMERVMDSVTYRRSSRRNVCCLVKLKDLPPA